MFQFIETMHVNVVYRDQVSVSIYRDIGNVMWYYQRH